MLGGCGVVTSGVATQYETESVKAVGKGKVSWFDAGQAKTANIEISSLTERSELPFEADVSRIPLTATTSLKCFRLISSDDVSGLYDMQALSMDMKPLIYVNTVYDGAVYPLGGEWYGVIVPNGFNEKFLIRIGNVYFEVG